MLGGIFGIAKGSIVAYQRRRGMRNRAGVQWLLKSPFSVTAAKKACVAKRTAPLSDVIPMLLAVCYSLPLQLLFFTCTYYHYLCCILCLYTSCY